MKLKQGIGLRIYSIVLVSVLASFTVAATMYVITVRNIYQMRETHLRDVVDSSTSLLAALNARVQKGEMTLEEAKAEGARLLGEVKYDGSNYLFAFDYDTRVVAHGRSPDSVGKDYTGFTDPNGVKVYAELRDKARQDGSGMLFYSSKRGGTDAARADELLPKMSFARAFAPWSWVIATGAYIEDINAEIAHIRNMALLAFFVGLVTLGLVSWRIAGSVTGPINRLNARMQALSKGDVDSEVPCVAMGDEIGEMARSVLTFQQDIRRGAEMEAVAARQAAEKETAREQAETERRQRTEAELAAEGQRQRQAAAEQEERDRLRQMAEAERQEASEKQQQVVSALADALKALAAGNLGVRIEERFPDGYDSLRMDFNNTVSTLAEVIGTISETAGSIQEQGEGITHGAEDVARRSETASAALEETAAALEQLTGSVRQAAQGSAEADRVAVDARGDAEKSGEIVREAVKAMGSIEQSSERISRIIHVIDDIAFQTNLLALNAGVEAARAGDAGRGFAVVAAEVRALAQRSSDAAREINLLISESGGHVTKGVALVGEAGKALERIVESVSEIASHVSDTAQSAQEQSLGLGEINSSVARLDQTTQANTAMFQETLVASRSLTQQAMSLREMVGRFSVTPSAQGRASGKVVALSRKTY